LKNEGFFEDKIVYFLAIFVKRVSLKTYNVRNCRKFCGRAKKKMKGALRARTDKFSDAAIRRDNVSQGARLGLALGFLETPKCSK
jgi:hypothetical protein